jgi:hypothetical protein
MERREGKRQRSTGKERKYSECPITRNISAEILSGNKINTSIKNNLGQDSPSSAITVSANSRAFHWIFEGQRL